MKEEWSCASMECGALFVMISGMTQMLQLSAISLDLVVTVSRYSTSKYSDTICIMFALLDKRRRIDIKRKRHAREGLQIKLHAYQKEIEIE